MTHFVSICCKGERCRMCEEPASHKVAEVIQHDDPHSMRHELAAYICCLHFAQLMGRAAPCKQTGEK